MVALRLAPGGGHRPPGRRAPDDLRVGGCPREPHRPRPSRGPRDRPRAALRDALPPRHPHPVPDVARRAGGDRRRARRSGVQRRSGRRVDPRLPDRAAGAARAAPGHLALGPVSRRCARGAALQRAGAPLRRGQPRAWTWRPRAWRSRWTSRDAWRPRRARSVELDDAEEAEVVSATVADLVDAISAAEGEPDAQGRPTFTTTSPNWWVGGRTFGGMVVAQALSAALQTAPAGLDVHSLHGYFLRPTPRGPHHPRRRGRPRRPVVQHPRRREHRWRARTRSA